jgi:hypothetical protein
VKCPRCGSRETSRRRRRTTLGYRTLGYRTFGRRDCSRLYNERTGTPFNELQHPTDVVLLAVLWRLRYKLSFRDVAEMLLERGFELTHATVRDWEISRETSCSRRFTGGLLPTLKLDLRGLTCAQCVDVGLALFSSSSSPTYRAQRVFDGWLSA